MIWANPVNFTLAFTSSMEFEVDWDALNPVATPALPDWWPDSAGLSWHTLLELQGTDAMRVDPSTGAVTVVMGPRVIFLHALFQ